jgi:hypothetical protein
MGVIFGKHLNTITAVAGKRILIRLTSIMLVGITGCAGSDETVDEEADLQSEQRDSEPENSNCKVGLGLMVNYNGPAPSPISVIWRTSEHDSVEIHNDCQGESATQSVSYLPKDLGFFIDDQRYETLPPASFSLEVSDCESGRVLNEIANYSIDEGKVKECRYVVTSIQFNLE